MSRDSATPWLWLGVLSFVGLPACGGGNGKPASMVSVSISPKRAAVAASSQLQPFTATVTGTTNLTVNWSVDGFAGGNASTGTITATGVYTPPAVGGVHTVTATSAAQSGASASATVAVTDLAGVFTYHNDLARDGANVQEYALTPSSVTTTTFGKLFSCPVDGAVYAQPLWVPGVNIGGGTHNVILVATQHDTFYAFDADANPCVTYWQVNLLDTLHRGSAGETPVVWNDVGNIGGGCFGDIYAEVGVTGTPVIDPASNTIYVVSAPEIPGANSGTCSLPTVPFYHRLHALDLFTGSEKFNAPATIAASVPGVGDGSSGGMVSFSSQFHHNRSGLTLSGGNVYVAFAAHEDQSPYHGWLLGYSASDLSQAPSIFNTTPNGGLGGIWAGGSAPSVDSTGDIYVSTGNGVFDANSATIPFNDFGDSILRLHPFVGTTSNGLNLGLAGWFTPNDQAALSSADADVGSGGVVLLPDQTNGPKHLLVQVGKAQPQPGGQGIVFLVDRDNMGQYGPNNNVVQSFAGPTNGLWGAPAFWQNNLYIGGAGDSLKQFSFDQNTGMFNPTVSSQSATVFGYTGDTPSVSSQGASDGIVWTIDSSLYGYASPNAGVNCSVLPLPGACTGPAILHAYDATNLGTEYWNSTLAEGNRDQAGSAVKFVPPTVANGKVYVGTRSEIDVYGLLPD